MKLSFLCLVVTILFSLDSISKLWAIINFRDGEYILIKDIFSFVYVQNPGIAFSIPLTWIFLKVLTVILIFGIIFYYFYEERQKSSKLVDISFAMIIAWALWNAYERLLNGYVTDFIAVEYFAIFNLADSYITLGAIGLVYYYFKYT